MATVYLAHDGKHRREVALKVLLPGLAAFLGVERFLKEIQIAAGLTHPHILALHDSGEAGGFLYYVMPYIEGGSLRQRLAGGRRLHVDEALTIAAPVADALSYAHRMGVFHRDIKPENVLFSQGHPIVADFGIAKAISAAGGANLTRTGSPLGTPGYMSPEQAAGLTDLDERTDVYSLAVVIYEMLVGEPPGRWPTEDAVRTGRFLEATASHRLRLTEAGSRLEGALVHALAIRLDQRTLTPGALIDELSGAASPPRRRYSGGEVQEIVKRASELEATTPTAGGAMTLGGVEALAAEVGIASRVVRAAAESLVPAPAPAPAAGLRRNRWVGGPTTLLFERVVEGEVPDSEWLGLVDEIRRVMNNVGQVSQFGRSFSWVAARRGNPRKRAAELAHLSDVVHNAPDFVHQPQPFAVRDFTLDHALEQQRGRPADPTVPPQPGRGRRGRGRHERFGGRAYDAGRDPHLGGQRLDAAQGHCATRGRGGRLELAGPLHDLLDFAPAVAPPRRGRRTGELVDQRPGG